MKAMLNAAAGQSLPVAQAAILSAKAELVTAAIVTTAKVVASVH